MCFGKAVKHLGLVEWQNVAEMPLYAATFEGCAANLDLNVLVSIIDRPHIRYRVRAY